MSDVVRAAGLLAVTLLLVASAVSAADEPPVSDPTRPPGYAFAAKRKNTDDTLLLFSTSVSPSVQSAVINNQVVTVGAHIAGAVVIAIEQGRVTLRRGSEAIVLQLFNPPVKRPARDSS